MKQFFMKSIWAFFWLIFGLMLAQNYQINNPVYMSLISLASLLTADALKTLIRKILTHALT